VSSEKPCPYCVGYREKPGDPSKVEKVWADGTVYHGTLAPPHPQCLESVAEYEAQKELPS
jgi:hypothetical protein